MAMHSGEDVTDESMDPVTAIGCAEETISQYPSRSCCHHIEAPLLGLMSEQTINDLRMFFC